MTPATLGTALAASPASPADGELTPAHFARITGMLYTHAGIRMREGKEGLVRARLGADRGVQRGRSNRRCECPGAHRVEVVQFNQNESAAGVAAADLHGGSARVQVARQHERRVAPSRRQRKR